MNDFFQGDDWTLNLNLKNPDGSQKDLTGATITFKLVQNMNCKAEIDQNFIIDPDPLLGLASISIDSDLTSNINSGLNWVSIQFVQDGKEKTIFQDRIQIKRKVVDQ